MRPSAPRAGSVTDTTTLQSVPRHAVDGGAVNIPCTVRSGSGPFPV